MLRSRILLEAFDNLIDIVDAATPGATTGGLQGGPEACVRGQLVVWLHGWISVSLGKQLLRFRGSQVTLPVADQIHGSDQLVAVHFDAHDVTVTQFADRPSSERVQDTADLG